MYGADVEVVRALSLLSVALPLADCRGNTALHYAVYWGRVELVDAMLHDPTPGEYQLIEKFHEHMAQSGEALQLYSFEQVLCVIVRQSATYSVLGTSQERLRSSSQLRLAI